MAVLVAVTASMAATAAPDNRNEADVHLVSVAVCAPWVAADVPPGLCASDSRRLVTAARGYFGDRLASVERLLNSEVTIDGLASLFERLGKRVGADDTVVFYLHGHGLSAPFPGYAESDGQRRRDWGLILWSEEPFVSPADALAEGKLLGGEDLFSALGAIPASRFVFVVDSCFSDALHYDLERVEAATGRDDALALVVSVQEDREAMTDVRRKSALFTAEITRSLREGEGNLARRVSAAADATREQSLRVCRENLGSRESADECWVQAPRVHDPDGILSTL